MVIYEERLTVPPSTSPDNRLVKWFSAASGRLEMVEIVFPSGCAGLVHCVVLYQDLQLAPASIGQDFSGDGIVISFSENLKLAKSPNLFGLRCWNEDDTFEHTITLRLHLESNNNADIERIKWLTGLA